MMQRRCTLTVASAKPNRQAISLFDRPCRKRLRTAPCLAESFEEGLNDRISVFWFGRSTAACVANDGISLCKADGGKNDPPDLMKDRA